MIKPSNLSYFFPLIDDVSEPYPRFVCRLITSFECSIVWIASMSIVKEKMGNVILLQTIELHCCEVSHWRGYGVVAIHDQILGVVVCQDT